MVITCELLVNYLGITCELLVNYLVITWEKLAQLVEDYSISHTRAIIWTNASSRFPASQFMVPHGRAL